MSGNVETKDDVRTADIYINRGWSFCVAAFLGWICCHRLREHKVRIKSIVRRRCWSGNTLRQSLTERVHTKAIMERKRLLEADWAIAGLKLHWGAIISKILSQVTDRQSHVTCLSAEQRMLSVVVNAAPQIYCRAKELYQFTVCCLYTPSAHHELVYIVAPTRWSHNLQSKVWFLNGFQAGNCFVLSIPHF